MKTIKQHIWNHVVTKKSVKQRKSSQQLLSICGNTFKNVGKAFQVKLVERMTSVCKAVTTRLHVYYFIVLMSSLLFYNIENSTNKEKP